MVANIITACGVQLEVHTSGQKHARTAQTYMRTTRDVSITARQ